MKFLPKVLIKITEEKFADDLLDGNLFMNNLKTFSNIEKSELNDAGEGSSIIYKNFFHIKNVLDLGKPIFCMYSEKEISKNKIIRFHDERLRKFGDTCVVIYNTTAFVNNVKLAGLKVDNVNYVKYSNTSFSVKSPIWDKPSYFSYQQEFRLYDNNAYANHFEKFEDRQEYASLYGNKFSDTDFYDKNNIGSIRKIAFKVPIEQLYMNVNEKVSHALMKF